MNTLAVIKNELFKDFLKIVSTDDLEKTLDNPDVPVPFECLLSVDNQNAQALADRLAGYFNHAKLRNKDFYKLDEQQLSQLNFMFDLIKLSSGQSASENLVVNNIQNTVQDNVSTQETLVQEKKEEQPIETPVYHNAVDNNITTLPLKVPANTAPEEVTEVQESVKEAAPEVVTVAAISEPVKEEVKEPVVEDKVEDNSAAAIASSVEEFDPFGFNEETDNKTKNDTIATEQPDQRPAAQEVKEEVTTPSVVESGKVEEQFVPSFRIPKNAKVTFFKNEAITGTLVDENTIIFDEKELTLNDAAKAAFRKSGMLGMPNGLNNWLYNGTALKDLKQ